MSNKGNEIRQGSEPGQLFSEMFKYTLNGNANSCFHYSFTKKVILGKNDDYQRKPKNRYSRFLHELVSESY